MELKNIIIAIKIADEILSSDELSGLERIKLETLKQELISASEDQTFNRGQFKTLLKELIGWVEIFIPALKALISLWI